MANFSSLENIGIKNRYKQVMTVIAFLTFTILLMFPLQNVFAQQPRVEITSSVPTISSTGQISIPQGQSSVTVRFNYRGIEGNDALREFRCSWDGNNPNSYSQLTCPDIDSGRGTYLMTGHASSLQPPGSYTFGVKVLNSGPNSNEQDPSRLSPAVTRSFTVVAPPTPPPAQLSVRITGATASGIPFAYGGVIGLQGQTTIPIRFTYEGTHNAINPSPIEFRCAWVGLLYGQDRPLAPNSCPDMSVVSPTMIRGSTESPMGAGPYTFIVELVNSEGLFTQDQVYPFTIIDTSRLPTASVYKANSYNVYATTSVPALGINNQYHTQNGDVTPYDKMYIVFQGFYPTRFGDRSDILATGVRTTFECKWDHTGSFVPCGRFNFVRSVSPGYHFVEFRAKNPSGMSGDSVTSAPDFYWCVRPGKVMPNSPGDPCRDISIRPASIITPSMVTNYISASPDVSFYPGKNGTISLQDLKEFPILNVTTGGTNQTISLQDLKEFPFGNKTIAATNQTIFEKDVKEFPFQNVTSSAKNTFQNKTVGTNTNATNVTSIGITQTLVNKSGNESLAKDK